MVTPQQMNARNTYRLGVRALELAAVRVKEACLGEDIDAAAIEAHFGLHAVYDLLENYFLPLGIKSIQDQDLELRATDGQVVGALALARGGRTHEMITFARSAGFGTLPYGMGPFGGGWVWHEYEHTATKFQERSDWYKDSVRWRLLWLPLEEAGEWFKARIPEAGVDQR